MFKKKRKACGGFIDLTKVLRVGEEPEYMHKKQENLDTFKEHAQEIEVSHGKGYHGNRKEPRCGNAS